MTASVPASVALDQAKEIERLRQHVARLRDALRDVIASPTTRFDDDEIAYVVLEVDRADYEYAQELLTETAR